MSEAYLGVGTCCKLTLLAGCADHDSNHYCNNCSNNSICHGGDSILGMSTSIRLRVDSDAAFWLVRPFLSRVVFFKHSCEVYYCSDC